MRVEIKKARTKFVVKGKDKADIRKSAEERNGGTHIMKDIIKKDLYRRYGEKGETVFDKLLRPPEIKFLIALRRANGSRNPFAKMRLRRISHKTGIQIPACTKIGEGFYIGHFGSIVINPNAVIGKNVNIAVGVTIGRENRGLRRGVPVIGDDVWIGTNAAVFGNIKIGNDVLIAPLSFVNFDVPDHSIVIGNPAKIISRENAIAHYINNRV